MTLTQITEKGIKDGEIVNADINASAAIALSKIATGALPTGITIASGNLVDGTIVNADINASAAIARSKIAEFVEDNVNDRVLTATGLSNTLQAESKLLFTSSGGDPVLTITGSSTAGHAQLNLKTGGTTDHGSINFGDNDDDDAGEIRYTHSTNLLAFDTNGTPKMVIDSNGKVGIGTTSPAELLHLQSTAGNTKLRLTQSGSTTDQTNGVIQFGNSTDAALCEIRGYTSGSNNSGYLQFLTTSSGNDVTAMTINTVGNVGIGTSSPAQRLVVHAGSDNSDVAVLTGGDVARGLKITTSATSSTNDSVVTLNAQTASHGTLAFAVANGSEAMRITSSGNVGINNSNPQNKLLVTDGGSVTLPVIQSHITNSNGGFLGFGLYSDINSKFTFKVTNNGRIYVNDGIDFSQTSHATGMTSEHLDDYEEGTFTPAVYGSTTAGSITYTYQNGVYTKIGRQVTVSVNLAVSSIGSAAGNLRISGFPFTPKNGTEGVTVAQWNQLGAGLPSGTANACPILQNPNTFCEIRCNNNAGSVFTTLPVQTLLYFRFTMTYFTA